MNTNYIFTLLLGLISLTISAQTITNTEAVEYDPTGNRFLITNSSSILQQASGSSELEFFGEGTAGYGMEVIGNTLYVITGNAVQRVNAYNLETEEEIFSAAYAGAGFLNGMASDPVNNRLWVTDFGNNDVIEVDVSDPDNVVFDVIVSNTVCTPNGITYDQENDRLVFVCWGGGDIRNIDLSDNSVSTVVNTDLSNMDGIDHDNNGNFYVSSWTPTQITRFSSEFTLEETISAPGLSSPADISYAVEIDTLAIANSGNNSITYIGFTTVGIDDLDNVNALQIYPNPITNHSYLEFHLDKTSSCEIVLLDQSGKEVVVLIDEKLSKGDHKVLLHGITLSKGLYTCHLKTDYSSHSINVIVH